jgi:hypothetical protein
MSEHRPPEFEEVAQRNAHDSILTDFWFLFRYSKKYWLMPVVIVLLLLGGLMMLSGTAVAPFIYTLF